MFPVRFHISDKVVYYKTANEAFAAANPWLKPLLCPEASNTLQKVETFDALAIVAKQAAEKLVGVKFGGANAKEVFENLKCSVSLEKMKEIELLEKINGLIEKYINRGAVGEVLLKQKIKKDGGEIMEAIKSAGVMI